tara:strand:+ start:302 stop:580 length:279 start_codon:yes stop_codon:yes gene_type:complete
MATKKNMFGICEVCGWRYKLSTLKKNSYGSLVCPTDFEGRHDLKNHPQNRSAPARAEGIVRGTNPEYFEERQKDYDDQSSNWNSQDTYWSLT